MAKDKEFAARQSIIDACLRLERQGVNQGAAGNISLRWKDGLLLTPSGMPYDVMTPDDIVFMNMDGSYDHEFAPSSEWRFHRDILHARPDVGAIVHAHPIYCTAFAICGMEIPAAHYMIALAGGPTVRCAPYATYGTAELSELVLEALSGRTCALMANHGMVATGVDLREALWIAVELETLCKQYATALQVGTPKLLDEAEVAKNVEKFKNYGLRRKTRAA
ncbi:class II aldolase/adducin family protein [Methylocapsa acidiphila]|uniref:class II aldolase/adducin family protein n=1 Tax=Methylocapsa acidiphila TaxID=133552 RepID=UPI00041DCDEB|nr:class II aldolase/adducin family protein [Methylocapsa acidiphila]